MIKLRINDINLYNNLVEYINYRWLNIQKSKTEYDSSDSYTRAFSAIRKKRDDDSGKTVHIQAEKNSDIEAIFLALNSFLLDIDIIIDILLLDTVKPTEKPTEKPTVEGGIWGLVVGTPQVVVTLTGAQHTKHISEFFSQFAPIKSKMSNTGFISKESPIINGVVNIEDIPIKKLLKTTK